MEILINEKEKHIQINELYQDDLEGYYALWQNFKNNYAGYEIDLCYHNCDSPIAFMEKIGVDLLESCIEMRLFSENFTPIDGFGAVSVTDKNFALFKALHDRANPGMFWTSERISQILCQWCIYICGDNYLMMSLWKDPEIFALQSSNAANGAYLLSVAASNVFQTDKPCILMMVDKNSPFLYDSARLVGFVECGRYVAYRGIL